VGSVKERVAALEADADIVVINFENLAWLMKTYKGRGIGHFDGLVIDEITKLSEVGSKTFKALRPRLPMFKWRVGATGTAVSENWMKLFGMMLLLDSGEALGTRKDLFLRKYFYATDFQEYNWELQEGAVERLSAAIAHLVWTMPDYRHELPALTVETVPIEMPAGLRDVYDEMKGTMACTIDGEEMLADNSAVLQGKLAQLASGFIYIGDEDLGDRDVVEVSEYRFDCLMDALEVSDGPTLVVYWFTADRDLLLDCIPEAVHMDSKNSEEISARWNAGEIDILLMHPRSGGHGLNLAKGGHEIIWYTPYWSRDLFEQTNARLWRRGQEHPVRVRELIAVDSVDELMQQRVKDKAEFEHLWEEYIG